jgi:large subunit ribosomal protein L9
MPIQVILTKDIEALGMQGETVAVKDGYARNFLIPRGLAIPATTGNLKRAEDLKRKRAEKASKELDAAKSVAEKLAALQVTLPIQMGEDGKAFGAVTAQDIVAALKAQGMEVDRRAVQLEHPLKQLGEVEVKIKLHHDLIAPLKVTVTKKEAAAHSR